MFNKKILILGGGFGGLYALKSIYKNLKKEIKSGVIQVTLVNEKNYFLFTPLLHEVVTGSVPREDVIHPLREICFKYKANFIKGEVREINLLTKNVKLKDGLVLSYDYLVVALGGEVNYYGIKGAKEYSLPLKNLDDAERIRNTILHNLEEASKIKDEKKKYELLKIIIAGGGPSGIEIAGEILNFFNEIKELYPEIDFKKVELSIFEAGSRLLTYFGDFISSNTEHFLKEKGVKIFLNSKVLEVLPDGILLEDQRVFKGGIILWNGGIKIRKFKTIPELKTHKERIDVSPSLMVDHFRGVFFIGDVCCISYKGELNPSFVPQTGQVAFQMGSFVGVNIKNLIYKKPLKNFYYKHKGFIVPLEKGYALAEIFGVPIKGILAWILYRLVYLSKLPGFINKIRIGFDWFIDFFFRRETSEY